MNAIQNATLYDIALKLLDKFIYSYQYQLDVVTIEKLVFESYEELIERGITEIKNIKGYLYRMIKHKILKSLKEVKRLECFLHNRILSFTPVMEVLTEQEENDKKQEILFKLLEKMPERKRELIRLRIIEGQAFSDIAVTLNIRNVNTASKTFYRALVELKRDYLRIIKT